MTQTERAAVRALAVKLSQTPNATYAINEMYAVMNTTTDDRRMIWLLDVAERYSRLLRAKETK